MGYRPDILDRLVAYVPKGKKYYVCSICGVNFNRVKMIDHLTRDHNCEIESGGYAIYYASKEK